MVRFFLTGTTAIATFIIRLVLLGLVHNITTTRAFSSILVHYPSIATTTTTTTTHLKMSSSGVLNRVTPDKVALEIKDPVDPTALGQAKAILEELTANNHQPNGSVHGPALLKVAQRLGDLSDTAIEFVVSKQACQEAYESLTDTERTALTNIYQRIKRFAEFQRQSVVDMEMDIPGGKAGHTVSPCRGECLVVVVVFWYNSIWIALRRQ